LPKLHRIHEGKGWTVLPSARVSSFWVTITDSETNGHPHRIDVTAKVLRHGSGEWGAKVLVGTAFRLVFQRSNIFVDEFLSGYGQVSDRSDW